MSHYPYLLLIAALMQLGMGMEYIAKPLPLLLPLTHEESAASSNHGAGHHSHALALQPEGEALLQSLEGGCVAPVVVIGPYRSGKSFLLNQLLGVSCDAGFGVGHTRATQTKGIWVWGEPVNHQMDDGSTCKLLFIDTEGFESTGRSNAYDDRIFALSALTSSLLIYNLPEAIRESDIAKLSFAVQLAEGLYERLDDKTGNRSSHAGSSSSSSSSGTPGSGLSFTPGSMLWLIQRDFLNGAAAAQVVAEALAPVDNPSNDPEVTSLNAVRDSLGALAATSTGYSLPQAHLQRTRLCELPDSELEQSYVKARDQLRTLVRDLATPKMLGGMRATGPQLLALLRQLVTALNAQDIPDVASLLDAFNRDLVGRCIASFTAQLGAALSVLPVPEEKLASAAAAARAAALVTFKSSLLGARRGPRGAAAAELEGDLVKAMNREQHLREAENKAASDTMCEQLEAKCELELDAHQKMRLPSLKKFNNTFQRCEHEFLSRCVGPARRNYEVRLARAWKHAHAEFAATYNGRLHTGLLLLCSALVAMFRFVVRLRVGEAVGWVGLAFLWLYPRYAAVTTWPLAGSQDDAVGEGASGAGSMYSTRWWQWLGAGWEGLMLIFFGFDAAWVLWVLGIVGFVGYRVWLRRRRRKGRKALRTHSNGRESVLRDLEV